MDRGWSPRRTEPPRPEQVPLWKEAFAALVLLTLALASAACTDRMDPLGVTAHPDGWVDQGSVNFHGKAVLESINKAANCASCHGTNYAGGSAGVGCFGSGCHAVYPHSQGFAETGSEGFHGRFIADRGLWDLSTCQSCHGADYAGEGTPEKNCLTCHTQQDGPEACTTCHGSAQSLGPPPDVLGNTDTRVRSVGAHAAHSGVNRWTTAITLDCAQCHVMPSSFTAAGHLDDGPVQAEVTLQPTHGVVPVWDPATATCSNLYCHGDFAFSRDVSDYPWAYTDSVIAGNNPRLVWTEVGTGQADCGTCHSLPPLGHRMSDGRVTVEACNVCHPRVVDENDNIINKALHINGQIEVF